MRETIDIATLKTRVNIVDVIGKYLSLKKKGAELSAMCCFHADKHASLLVNERKQIFKCFACGTGGDAIDFLTLKGITYDEAIKVLQELAGEVRPRYRSEDWIQIQPKDDIAFEIKHYTHGVPSKIWRYADEQNNLIGFVCRFDLPDGKKETIPFTLCKHVKTGNASWRWHGFGTPRTLYNMYELACRPDDIALIVEGEKTCDAAKLLYPELVCITWQGGARAVKQTNWNPLHGKKIILVPDNDSPGYQAMREITDLLIGKVQSVRTVKIPDVYPEHWDLADVTWSRAEAQTFLKSNLYLIKPLKA